MGMFNGQLFVEKWRTSQGHS